MQNQIQITCQTYQRVFTEHQGVPRHFRKDMTGAGQGHLQFYQIYKLVLHWPFCAIKSLVSLLIIRQLFAQLQTRKPKDDPAEL
jgi:hypothetical protein